LSRDVSRISPGAVPFSTQSTNAGEELVLLARRRLVGIAGSFGSGTLSFLPPTV
jgi:hypothetical protein